MSTSPRNVQRILFTNTAIAGPTGTELYIRDLAREFRTRGCDVVIYTPRIGPLAAELHGLGIPVVDRLDALGDAPDIIHGQHHLPTLQAMLAFPETPAVFVCHGWRPWEEMPPALPRIRRHIAVDPVTRDRIVHEGAIPPSRVEVIPNFVDLEQFRPRWPLPDWPERAAIFSNYVRPESPYFRAVSMACSRLGLDLDVIGSGFGTATDRPGDVLADYDLVFAQGRSAIEAIAVGASVIVASSRAFGPLVRPDNYPELRRFNFGMRALVHPVEPGHIEEEIRHYDPVAAAAVTVRLRGEADLRGAADALMGIYEEAVAEHLREPGDPHAEHLALAAELGRLDERLRKSSEWETRAANLERRFAELQLVSKERGRVIRRMERTRLWKCRNWLRGLGRKNQSPAP